MVITIKNRESFLKTDFKVRSSEESGDKYLEGYFIKFNDETELMPGIFEEVKADAIKTSLKENDIRCLFNHDTGIVLGRSGNDTLELKADDIGLYGKVKINTDDKQAMDIVSRIERGDINACSFGFNINENGEDIENREDGSVKFTLTDIDLKEVSAVTFPAYPSTSIQARQKQITDNKKRELSVIKNKLFERLDK